MKLAGRRQDPPLSRGLGTAVYNSRTASPGQRDRSWELEGIFKRTLYICPTLGGHRGDKKFVQHLYSNLMGLRASPSRTKGTVDQESSLVLYLGHEICL